MVADKKYPGTHAVTVTTNFITQLVAAVLNYTVLTDVIGVLDEVQLMHFPLNLTNPVLQPVILTVVPDTVQVVALISIPVVAVLLGIVYEVVQLTQ